MMILPMTSLYATVLGVFLLVLTLRVIALRGNPVFKFLSFGKSPEVLERAIRGHGNFTEYAPFFLILLGLAEMNGAGRMWLEIWATLFTLGRLTHGLMFCFMPRHNFPMRIAGMVATLVGLIGIMVTLWV